MPGSAAAESLPAPHLRSYGVDWIGRVPASQWSAPVQRPAVCVVDAGVAITPDTPATSSDGPIIARLAIDGGSGEPQGTTDEHLHGTQMISQIIAPQNGWGIVGVWPQGRVISVRATIGETTGFSSGAYINGAKMCMDWALEHDVQLAAISLSLGSSAGGSAEAIRVEDMTIQAHARGISVIAAGGNVAGAQTPLPARGEGVLSVGAGSSPIGSWCSYATHDSRTDLVGPACPVAATYLPTGDEVSYDGGGSSTATAVVAGVAGALRALVPGSTWQQVEQWLSAGPYALNGAPILDGVAAAKAAGLQGLLTPSPEISAPTPAPTLSPSAPQTIGPVPTPASSPSSPGSPPSLEETTILVRPEDPDRIPRPDRLTATWKAGRLTVRTRATVPGARLQITVRRGGKMRTATAPSGRSSVSIATPRTTNSVTVRWKARTIEELDSDPRTLKRPRAGWPRR